MPPSVDEWLPQKHLARFVVEVIDGLDLRAMIGSYRGSGSASYHPRMLLGILVYGYATGVFSSRKLERATYDSVAFRFIAANDHPDHDTIAAFRRRFLKEIGDLMAFSCPGQNNVVLTERKSRYILAARQPDKTAATTTASLNSLLRDLPEHAKRSITFDNGGEFVGHASLGLKTYFCDPHSPWQKGGVENAIGRLRRDLPRSTTPTDYSPADFHDIIAAHNDTPRKCLAFRTPAEAILSEINQLRCT